jgi:hypothetical protein
MSITALWVLQILVAGVNILVAWQNVHMATVNYRNAVQLSKLLEQCK